MISESQLKALLHGSKLYEKRLLESGVTPSCIYMNAVTYLIESPDTIIGYPVVVDNKLGEDIVCLA